MQHYVLMQAEYLALLNESVQKFVQEVEEKGGVPINVIPDINQNVGGTSDQGKLAIVIKARSIQLFAPTNGYFPNGGVRHEVLHVQRFLVDGVPKLALANNVAWDQGFSDALGGLDNAIEHVIIVPVELKFNPERIGHWEAVMRNVCDDLERIPNGDRPLAVSLHWTFLKHVLPESPSITVLKNYADKNNLLDVAEIFAARFIEMVGDKENIVRLIIETFPEIPKDLIAFEYINKITGTHQKPIS